MAPKIASSKPQIPKHVSSLQSKDISSILRGNLTDPNFFQWLNNIIICCAEVRVHVEADFGKLAYSVIKGYQEPKKSESVLAVCTSNTRSILEENRNLRQMIFDVLLPLKRKGSCVRQVIFSRMSGRGRVARSWESRMSFPEFKSRRRRIEIMKELFPLLMVRWGRVNV